VKNNGIVMMVVMIIIFALFAVGTVVFRITFSERMMVRLELDRKTAFYLAEAGIEKAKVILVSNPDWFTDLAHEPSDDMRWLIKEAEGEKEDLGEGCFKMVRESGKNMIYSIGYHRKNAKNPAVSIIMIKFESDPFRQTSWQIM